MTVVSGVRDGFSSKPDVAPSFLPTVAAAGTEGEASFPTTSVECPSQVHLEMGRGVQLALWVNRVATGFKQHTAKTCKRSWSVKLSQP